MSRLRGRGPLVFLCIAILAVAMCAPAGSDLFTGVLEPVWVLFAPAVVYAATLYPECDDEQPSSLRSFDASRAPPATASLA